MRLSVAPPIRLPPFPMAPPVGSSSLRRQALIRRIRPDIEVITFRGLVETRLRKLSEGQVDATLLAYAGLKRLAKQDVVTELLDPQDFPRRRRRARSASKAVSVDVRIDALLEPINDRPTYDAVSCERAFLAALDGSCRTPIGGYAICEGDHLKFSGLILTPDGRKEHSIETEGKRCQRGKNSGRQAGEAVRAAAGPDFFEGWA
jgi:hydroxymethylbilane synthase